MPCGSGGEEGGALIQRLGPPLARWRDGGGKFHDFAQRGNVTAGAMGVTQQDRIVASRAEGQDVREPGAQGVAVGYVAGFHRPFQAVRVGIGAGRERRRQPGEQANQMLPSPDPLPQGEGKSSSSSSLVCSVQLSC